MLVCNIFPGTSLSILPERAYNNFNYVFNAFELLQITRAAAVPPHSKSFLMTRMQQQVQRKRFHNHVSINIFLSNFHRKYYFPSLRIKFMCVVSCLTEITFSFSIFI